MGAEPGEVIAEGSRGAVLAVMAYYLLRWLLPPGYRFRWIRLYAEKEEERREIEEAKDETQ